MSGQRLKGTMSDTAILWDTSDKAGDYETEFALTGQSELWRGANTFRDGAGRLAASMSVLLYLLLSNNLQAADAKSREIKEINTLMMESTFKLLGENGSMGTGFVVGKRLIKNPDRMLKVLVTANHVLDQFPGTNALIVIRARGANDSWETQTNHFQIRRQDKNLWIKHPEVDIAAMAIPLPEGSPSMSLPSDLLLDDDTLKKYGIHPGDELHCLGFPFGFGSPTGGFPILRSGRIASYPLLPTKQTKTFLYTFPVFPGNSGGPVYLVERNPIVDGGMLIGQTAFGVVGVVVKEHYLQNTTKSPDEITTFLTRLSIAEVVHASFVKQLVDQVPDP